MNKSWIVLALFATSLAFGGELKKFELEVKPELSEEFQKPLPEFIAYAPDGSCLMHSRGFSTQEHFLAEIAKVMDGENMIRPAPPITEEVKAQIRAAVEQSDQIPEEFKEQAYENSLAQIANPPAQCDKSLDELMGLYRNVDNSAFKAKKVNRDQMVFIEYHAEWCVPCRKQELALEHFAKTVRSDFSLLKVERDIKKVNN